MKALILDEVIEKLKILPHDQQRQVLEFARALALSIPRGVPGRELLRFAGALPPEEIQLMSEAIEQGCERIDGDEW